MGDAYYEHRKDLGGSAVFAADPATAGPWSPQLQHGGPPTALAVCEAERAVADATGRRDLLAMRVAAEFVGPVPVADLTVRATVVRAARTAALAETAVVVEDRVCLTARVWFLAATDTAGIATETAPPAEPAGGLLEPGTVGASFPYADSIDWIVARGGALAERGPSAVWARARRPVVADRPVSGLQRAALFGDSASGISAELDWTIWSFLNVDLDIHLVREPAGEWLLLDAITDLGPTGAGLARAVLSDQSGLVGASLQTLVVEPRRR